MKQTLLAWSAATLFVLYQFTFQLSSGSLVHALMDDFQINAATAGFLASAYYYLYAAFQIPAGLLLDRYGPRNILSLGALLAGCGCLIFATSINLGGAFIGRLIFGGGAAFAFIGMLYVTRLNFPLNYYALVAGLAETLGLLASMIGTVLIASCLHYYGWRPCFLLGAFMGLVLSIACYATVTPKTTCARLNFLTLKHDLKQVLSNHAVWCNGLYLSIIFTVLTVFAALWSTPFLMVKLSLSLPKASMLSACCFMGAAVGCPLFGYLIEKIKSRLLTLFFSSSMTTLILLLVLFSPSTHYLLHAMLMFILGMVCSSHIISFSICDQLAPRQLRNTVAGLTNTLAVLSVPLLQPFIGALIDQHHTHANLHHYQQALVILPVLTALNCILLLWIPEREDATSVTATASHLAEL